MLAGLPELPATTGRDLLLAEILIEEYIAGFQSIEPWNLYKRTCTPNLAPVVAGKKIPARFPYDVSERNTNTKFRRSARSPCATRTIRRTRRRMGAGRRARGSSGYAGSGKREAEEDDESSASLRRACSRRRRATNTVTCD